MPAFAGIPEQPARVAGVLVVPSLLVWHAPVAVADGNADRIDALLARYRELGLFNGSPR